MVQCATRRWILSTQDSKHHDEDGRCGDTRSKKGPPAPGDKDFKPCHVHGEKAKHSYEECRVKPRNQANKSCENNNNKHVPSHHESHYHHDALYVSSDDESRGSDHTPMPSDGEEASAESGGSKTANENFHLSFEGMAPKKHKLTDVASLSHMGKPAKSSK